MLVAPQEARINLGAALVGEQQVGGEHGVGFMDGSHPPGKIAALAQQCSRYGSTTHQINNNQQVANIG